MKRYLLEECYELIEAMDEEDTDKLVEELGDVLFNIAFQIQMGMERGILTYKHVFQSLNDKLIRRHPHLFSTESMTTIQQAEESWHHIKQREAENPKTSALENIPNGLPALSHAQLLQERAARTGFDWEEVVEVIQKISEEIEEFNLASSAEEREREMGDVLFSLVNLCRWIGLDAEGSLRGANARFHRRFKFVEKFSSKHGKPINSLPTDVKEAIWQEAKDMS